MWLQEQMQKRKHFGCASLHQAIFWQNVKRIINTSCTNMTLFFAFRKQDFGRWFQTQPNNSPLPRSRIHHHVFVVILQQQKRGGRLRRSVLQWSIVANAEYWNNKRFAVLITFVWKMKKLNLLAISLTYIKS